MGNATSLFNLMRNIGGSIGIATTGTLLARHSRRPRRCSAPTSPPTIPTSQSMFAQMRGAFMAAGADAVTATKRAYAALFGMVQRQATMVSFVGIFQLLGVLFFALMPLVLLMKRPGAALPRPRRTRPRRLPLPFRIVAAWRLPVCVQVHCTRVVRARLCAGSRPGTGGAAVVRRMARRPSAPRR